MQQYQCDAEAYAQALIWLNFPKYSRHMCPSLKRFVVGECMRYWHKKFGLQYCVMSMEAGESANSGVKQLLPRHSTRVAATSNMKKNCYCQISMHQLLRYFFATGTWLKECGLRKTCSGCGEEGHNILTCGEHLGGLLKLWDSYLVDDGGLDSTILSKHLGVESAAQLIKTDLYAKYSH